MLNAAIRTLCIAEGRRKLNLLLSFAVGSLLGDVFLHLLPEVWIGYKGVFYHFNIEM